MGNRKETIERIKNSSRKLFWERGFKDVTMQEISDDVGITKGLLNHYFPQKCDIVSAINYQDFMRIYNYVRDYTDGDNYLAYLVASYRIRQAAIEYPRIREIERDSISSKKAMINEGMGVSQQHSLDTVYIDIIKQFNLYISMTEMNTRTHMARGAVAYLARRYERHPEIMTVEDYLKHAVLSVSIMFDIPYFTREEYYEKAMKLIQSGVIPKFDYTKNNFSKE